MSLFKIALFSFLAAFSGLSLLGLPARADNDAPAFHVQQVDPSFDSQQQAAPGVKVHSADELHPREWKIPSAEARNQIFEQAGLKDDVRGLDEMDKDTLYLMAHDSSAKTVIKKYPKLSKEKLLRLIRLAKETPS